MPPAKNQGIVTSPARTSSGMSCRLRYIHITPCNPWAFTNDKEGDHDHAAVLHPLDFAVSSLEPEYVLTGLLSFAS